MRCITGPATTHLQTCPRGKSFLTDAHRLKGTLDNCYHGTRRSYNLFIRRDITLLISFASEQFLLKHCRLQGVSKYQLWATANEGERSLFLDCKSSDNTFPSSNSSKLLTFSHTQYAHQKNGSSNINSKGYCEDNKRERIQIKSLVK